MQSGASPPAAAEVEEVLGRGRGGRGLREEHLKFLKEYI